MPDWRTDGTAVANVGYARVSTQDQDLSFQFEALAAAGCGKLFEDRASGASADRAGLQATLGYVRKGEVLVVRKLDRLGRSLPHLIETVMELAKRGVGFRSRPRRSTPPHLVAGSSSTSLALPASSGAT